MLKLLTSRYISIGWQVFPRSLEETMNPTSAEHAYLIALERERELLDDTRPLSAPWRGLFEQLRSTLGR